MKNKHTKNLYIYKKSNECLCIYLYTGLHCFGLSPRKHLKPVEDILGKVSGVNIYIFFFTESHLNTFHARSKYRFLVLGT